MSDFAKSLDDIASELQHLSESELDNIVDWTFNSLAHSILKNIRAVWPIDTKQSYNKWQFEKRGKADYWIVNYATNPYDGAEYVQYVYAKGDTSRYPIADDIVAQAIEDIIPDVEESFTKRLERYLS